MRLILLLLSLVVVLYFGAKTPSGSAWVERMMQGEAQPQQVIANEVQEEDEHHPAPEQHMIVETPATVALARTMLAHEQTAVKAAWEARDLEAIHMSSYSLEAALARMEEDAAEQGDEAALEHYAAMQRLVYDIHHASENGLEAKVAKYLPTLLTALQATLAPAAVTESSQ